MSQVSRPVQLALLAVVVLGALWFFALRPRTQSTTSPPAPAPAPAPAAAAPATAPKPYNTKTPVIGGLLGDVNKANAAVATSQANANTLEHDSGAASSPTGTPVTTASASAAAPASGRAAASSPSTATTPQTATHPGATSGAAAGSAAATHPATAAGARTATHAATTSHATGVATASVSPAVTIKNELADGKTVALLFWNPLGTDDQAVHGALLALAKGDHSLVVDSATAGQVANYGTIVTTAQVLETPTLLIMHGKSIQTITDLQDPTDLHQYLIDLQAGGPGEVLMPSFASYAAGTTRAAYLAKANAFCSHAQNATVVISPSDTPAQILSKLAAANERYLAQLAAIPPPAADRQFIHDLLTTSAAGDRETAAALTASNPYTGHNLLLSGETNSDRAVQMAEDYGLADCVVANQR